MGAANRKKIQEANEKLRSKLAWQERWKKAKRVPRALFYAVFYPIWLPLFFFQIAMKNDKFPWEETKET